LNELGNPLQIWYRDGGRPFLRTEYKATPKWTFLTCYTDNKTANIKDKNLKVCNDV